MNRLLAFWRRWLYGPEPEPTFESFLPPAMPPERGASTEIVEAAWREGNHYGFAAGQLSGRQQLLDEIAARFAARARPIDEYNEADLETDKARQLH